MTNEKTESERESAKKIAQDAIPCLGDYGVGCGIEHSPRCPAIYRSAVAAAIEAAVAKAIEGKDAEIANTIPHHQHREIMCDLRETSLKAVGHLQAEVERLQADLAAAERTRIDPQAYRDLEIRIQALEYENEKLKDEVVVAEQRGREKACVLVQALCRACRGSGIEINWRGEEQVCECCGRVLDAIRTANK